MAQQDNHADPGKKPEGGIGSYGPVPSVKQPYNGGHVNGKIQPNLKQPDAPAPCGTYEHDFKK